MEYNVIVWNEIKFQMKLSPPFCMKYRTLLPEKMLLTLLHENLNFLYFNFPHLFAFPTNFPHLLFFIFLFCSFIYRNTCYYNIHNVYYTIQLVGKVGKVIVFLQKFIQYTLLLAPCSLKYRKQRSEGAKGARSKHHFKYFCKTTFPTPHFPTFLMFSCMLKKTCFHANNKSIKL